MKEILRLLDDTNPNEAKIESIRRFNGPTDAARIYVETFAESASMSRTARDVLKALAQIMSHGNGFWYACPKIQEERLIKSCLRLTDDDYESALGEIWRLKCVRKSNDGRGILIDDKYMVTSDGKKTLKRFAVLRRNDGNLEVNAAFVSYDD